MPIKKHRPDQCNECIYHERNTGYIPDYCTANKRRIVLCLTREALSKCKDHKQTARTKAD